MSLIKQDLINSSKYSLKCPYEMKPIGVVIHNTYNDAPAKNEIAYMKRNEASTGYHIAVDDKEAIQVIPFTRNAFANGDGRNGEGNRKYISIEICYSKSGGSRFTNAEKLAAKVAAELLKKYGWGIDRVKAHRDFAKKDCPHRTNMTEFKKLVQKELGNTTTNTFKSYVVRVICDSLNIREGVGTSHKVVGTLKKGDAYTIVEEKDGWGLLKSYQSTRKGWISLNQKYVQKV